MYYIGVDLGSTNIKVAIYTQEMKLVDRQSYPVEYIRKNGFVEFDADLYCGNIMKLIGSMITSNQVDGTQVAQITFTGQAESLVVLNKGGNTMMNAISWMDERSVDECEKLSAMFTHEEIEAVTGQMAVLPTWPATKILWLKENRPEIYDNAATYMMLKDFVVYKLTGKKVADMSIATFTFYFDIYEKKYWSKMLDAIGVSENQLPPLVEPCTVAGNLTEGVAKTMNLSQATKVNVGTLDHFTGMVGTGNVQMGGMTLSTGTVMALTTMAAEPAPRDSGIAMHYGFQPDTHIMLPVAESGGASLEWFRRTCMGDISYDQMNTELQKRDLPNNLIFLPFLVGTNSPEFDTDANGVFFGLRQESDVYDMACAVMEGVAFMLRKNCDHIRAKGTEISYIIATGGGAKSPIWCQLQADITGLPVVIPTEKEAACLGCAIIGAVSDGLYASYQEAADKIISFQHRYEPVDHAKYEKKYEKYCALYEAMLKVTRL
ncbi:MAG: hypothetical protein E7437_05115 [Ruminococcaceae bacterium]|nr:hypothetical protein [Oscillospiraceae bacterium]